jgi:hypothetical protein
MSFRRDRRLSDIQSVCEGSRHKLRVGLLRGDIILITEELDELLDASF